MLRPLPVPDADRLVLLEPQDFDQWLAGTVEDASTLIRLTPVERFDAGPMPAAQAELM